MEHNAKREAIINTWLFFRRIFDTILYTIIKVIRSAFKLAKSQIRP